MSIDSELARLRAGLDRDERIALAAIGKRGSEAGAVVQHWQWELAADDEIVLTDGSAPIDAAYCYAEGNDRVTVDGPAILLTAERYPARVADWQLQDQLLRVEEPHAGAAQHIARNDPVRVLRQVEAIRRVIAEHEKATGILRENAGVIGSAASNTYWEGYQDACEAIATALASIYPTEES